jgi:hypothetical protein
MEYFRELLVSTSQIAGILIPLLVSQERADIKGELSGRLLSVVFVQCLLLSLSGATERECLLLSRSGVTERKCLFLSLSGVTERVCLLLSLSGATERECLLLSLSGVTERKCLFLSLSGVTERECLLLSLSREGASAPRPGNGLGVTSMEDSAYLLSSSTMKHFYNTRCLNLFPNY